MPSTNNKSGESIPLRRSTRSTRGSIKPIVRKDETETAEEETETKEQDTETNEQETKAKKNVTKTKKQETKTKKQDAETKTSAKTTIAKKSSKSKQPETDASIETEDVHIYYELSEKEMKEINKAFDMNCSTDGEELLCNDDLKTAIRSMGFEPRADEIQKLLEKFSNKNGKINRDGFHKIMAFKMGSSPGVRDVGSNDEISRVFNLLDLDKTGMITLENLQSISKELNEEITDEELHEMISEADIDGDFQINKQEFYNIMKKTSLY